MNPPAPVTVMRKRSPWLWVLIFSIILFIGSFIGQFVFLFQVYGLADTSDSSSAGVEKQLDTASVAIHVLTVSMLVAVVLTIVSSVLLATHGRRKM